MHSPRGWCGDPCPSEVLAEQRRGTLVLDTRCIGSDRVIGGLIDPVHTFVEHPAPVASASRE